MPDQPEDMVEVLFGMTEQEVRDEIYRRAGDAILARYPDIQDCVIPEVARAVLDAVVESDADDVSRAFMYVAGWW